MGTRLLVDTNVVIYYLGDALPDPATIMLDVTFEAEANLSVSRGLNCSGIHRRMKPKLPVPKRSSGEPSFTRSRKT